MFNLQLTADQLQFRDTIRNFVKNEIKPLATHPQRLEPFAKPLLRDCMDKASELGLRSILLSEEKGGIGADLMTACIVLEELAAGDVDVAMTIGETALIGHLLFDKWITKDQEKSLLERFVEQNHFHLSFTNPTMKMSEGWSYYGEKSENSQNSITYLEKNNNWVIKGSHPHISNALAAELFIVMAHPIKEKNIEQNMSFFLVQRDTPGLKIAELRDDKENSAASWRHGCSAAIEFDNCKIPLNHKLNLSHKELLAHATYGKQATLINAAINLGLGRAAFDTAFDYTQIRRQGGRNIIEHQAIGKMVADMAIKLELASTYIYKAAWIADHPEVEDDNSVSPLPHHMIASIFTAEAVNEVALIAAECFGAMGVMRDMPIQSYVNDSFMFLHSDINDMASKLPIAEMLIKFQGMEAA